MLLGCSSSDSDPTSDPTIDPSKLIGSWLGQSATVGGDNVTPEYKLEFLSNHNVKGYDAPNSYETGTYTTSGSSLTMDWSNIQGEIRHFTILELTSTKLKLKSFDAGEEVIEIYVAE